MDIEKIKKYTKTPIYYYKEINSTHVYGKQIEGQGDAILIAEAQTAGIGTKGRNWHTGENKNIAMTIIKHPNVKIEKLNGLTVEIAKKIKKIIKEMYDYDLEIKEPNDLMLNGKKISGILTESHTRGENVAFLLISIGFNVNETEFSEETKEIATSLKKEYKKEFDREEIIIKIIKNIEEIIEQL